MGFAERHRHIDVPQDRMTADFHLKIFDNQHRTYLLSIAPIRKNIKTSLLNNTGLDSNPGPIRTRILCSSRLIHLIHFGGRLGL
jgi:hypothetical protein